MGVELACEHSFVLEAEGTGLGLLWRGRAFSQPAGAGCGQRGQWGREASGALSWVGRRSGGARPARLHAAPPSGEAAPGWKEGLGRPGVVPGPMLWQPRAQGGGVGCCPGHRLGHTVDNEGPSSLPLNHCVHLPL